MLENTKLDVNSSCPDHPDGTQIRDKITCRMLNYFQQSKTLIACDFIPCQGF